jgi:outer membrane protein OmpA-like peptidoglycan-associated protein
MTEFSNDEAEVYKQGNKLLLRLKGLSFANGKAELTDKNFALLNKVKKVIGDVDASQVLIEGHTDSIGAKEINTALSEKRAKAVEAYLTADEGINAAKITTEGFGDTKPIATNKTAAGRSQNRRVDVVISAEPITE